MLTCYLEIEKLKETIIKWFLKSFFHKPNNSKNQNNFNRNHVCL
jgi:hypothetical protein